jgi:hypothetical protein
MGSASPFAFLDAASFSNGQVFVIKIQNLLGVSLEYFDYPSVLLAQGLVKLGDEPENCNGESSNPS